MPWSSERKKLLRHVQNVLVKRESAAMMRDLLSDEDSDEDELDEYWVLERERVQSTRYALRPPRYRKRKNRRLKLLHNRAHTTDTEFLKDFRVKRSEFFSLVGLLQHDPAFKSTGGKPFRGGVELHLMVLLKYLGAFGNGNTAPEIGKFLGIATGSVFKYLQRAVIAVLKLEDSTITWPDHVERREISQRIQEKYGFVNCVGIIDGTLSSLSTKPRNNGEGYYSRKSSYSVNALVTCDDAARIRSIVVGWPGSVHDNRVWINSPVATNPNQHFHCNEYLLGDSAFQASSIMIPAFKKTKNSVASWQQLLQHEVGKSSH